MVKEALVVKRDILFHSKYFEGFMDIAEFDYIPIILKNYSYHERGDRLENDFSLQQIIPYIIIINSKNKKLFAYRRAPDKRYSEVRLRDKWSIGLGGHVERQDGKNPLESGMMRELREEVSMNEYFKPKIIGFINDDKGDVEKVHFGVVALLDTTQDVKKGDDEMTEGRFYSLNEFEALISNPKNELEEWSRIALPFVRRQLG